ncbi:hypothetical protein PIB30_073937 [Stylosanthes scabra]|uniref:Uncharacterized protein n=1 Tax=Stylosanthes scabra TaxID=79078 RepID=A0ABU6SQG0_9FABA|nr:hypothetical protein [Stylosanthes scabra]
MASSSQSTNDSRPKATSEGMNPSMSIPMTLSPTSHQGRNPAAALKMDNHRDKPTIEYDPEIEKTLKKNRNKVKAQ